MPAIQPARLKIQAAQLASTYHQPDAFVRGLDDLCQFYANRTYRPGVSGESRPTLLQSFHLPTPVLRQIQLELAPFASEDAQTALALCRILWKEAILEYRLLAAGIIGGLPVNPAAPIVACLREWIESAPEDQLLNALLTLGTVQLRLSAPSALLELAEGWLNRTQILTLQAALRLLQIIANDPGFENLPAIYTRIASLVRVLPSAVRPDMVYLLTALIHRSPSETAYFLRDNLQAPNNPDTPWLLRQVLNEFPTEQQNSLRNALRR